MIRFFVNLFSRPPSSREQERRESTLLRSLVRRFARGNVRLQDGRYLTQQDVDHLKHDALHHI